ncbi:MAG: acyltransferase family protein [Acidimicrobiales bacterium]
MGSRDQPSHERAVTGRYLPGLDGLRALAIAGVFAYHLGYRWASGGYLGVDLFFVLSGYLITSLLVEERLSLGAIRFGHFWGRRARRLLPGLLVMLVAVVIFVNLSSGGLPIDWARLREEGIATIGYVANWQLLFSHQSYFDRFAVQSPLQHTWSLAIEEQFYLVWPLAIAVLMRLGRGRFGWRHSGLVVTLGGAALSASWMAWLWAHHVGANRLYYGTDTRAFDLLLGAALAIVTAGRPQPSAAARRLLHVGSVASLCLLGAAWATAGLPNGLPRPWMFEGGMALCALAGTAVVADVRLFERGYLAKVLSLGPVRYVGKISYGLYLWHWPVIVELTASRTHTSGLALTALRVGVAGVLAAASFHLIESPIRRGWLLAASRRVRAALVPASMLVTGIVVVIATVPPPVATASVGRTVRASRTAQQTIPGQGHVIGKGIYLGFRPSPSHRLRILVLGDSVMLSEAPAIEALFDSTHQVVVSNHSQWGFGLTTLKGWPAQVSSWIAQAHPDLVVAMWSWDNTAVAAHPRAYIKVIERFVRLVTRPGDGVQGLIFQQFPAPGPDNIKTTSQPDYPAKVASLIAGFDRLAISLTSRFPGKVMYLPLGQAVLLKGRFATWLPPEGNPAAPRSAWLRVRQVDNVHFCPAGAARYAAALMADIGPLFHLGLASPGWLEGSWTHNYLAYRFPDAGVCPNDHP